MITKQMLARCQNELKQAFCALDKDVQKAIEANAVNAQCCDQTGKWFDKPFCNNKGLVWRLSPDTPTESEYEEFEVYGDGKRSQYIVCYGDNKKPLAWVATTQGFLGIVYREKAGNETLRTSVDAAFGTPVRVRFAKD